LEPVVRVLIVGGSSYLGRSLGKKLADVCQVWGTFFRSAVAFTGERVHLDVRDRDGATKIFRQIEPGVIFYLAFDFNDIEGSIVIGTDHLLEARDLSLDTRLARQILKTKPGKLGMLIGP